jgi:outer membrane lipoprotein-sorting protein
MKKNLVFSLLMLFLFTGCALNAGNIGIIAKEMKQGWDNIEDYTMTAQSIDLFGEVTSKGEFIFKKPRNYKETEIMPDKKITSRYGDIKYSYDEETNVLRISTGGFPKISSQQEKEPEEDNFINMLKQLIKRKRVDVEDSVLGDKEVYKLTITPRSKKDPSPKEVYWLDKEHFLPVRTDRYVKEEQCQEIKEFVKKYTDLEVKRCFYSTKILDLNVNTGVSDDVFDLMNEVPDDAEIIKSEYVGECNPRRESAKFIDQASFNVLFPDYLPEGFYIDFDYPPEKAQGRSNRRGYVDPCPPNSYLLDYTNVHTESNSIGGRQMEFEQAEIRIGYKGENTRCRGNVNIEESTSPFNHYGVTFTHGLKDSKEVDINGNKGILIEWDFEKRLFWKVGDVYLNLDGGSGSSKSAKKAEHLKKSGESTIKTEKSVKIPEDMEIDHSVCDLTEEQMIEVAESMI